MNEIAVPQFKAGDLVRLLSGGPSLTVERVRMSTARVHFVVHVNWFSDAALNSAVLDERCLTYVSGD